ncbi:MAG: AAA family ATPase, partial [Clostridia bacterium]|nr:AAA family ATPase [Clostridia bacterium]
NFDTRSTHSDLHQYIKLIKSYRTPKWGFFLRAESFYNVSTNIDQMDEAPGLSPPVIDSYGGVSLHKQSHGESFLAVVENGFSANGLYILDEPEAALSPNGIMRLISNIHNLVKQGSQFIISTHSPMLMAYPDAEIYEITKDDIQSVEYKQTNHYVITRQFLENPQKMLNYLLDDN